MFAKFFQSDTAIKIFFVLLGFFVIQFFMIRPRKKEEEARDKFLKTLKIGMRVVTIGGVYGKVVKINDDKVVLEIDPRGFSFAIKKQAISQESQEQNK